MPEINYSFVASWLDRALPPQSQRPSTPDETLNELHLKALALADQDKNAEADAAYSIALEQARSSARAVSEEIPTIADICFSYGRLVMKLGRPDQGNKFITIALRLYTRLYGVDDGRTTFCVSRHRELARASNDSIALSKIQSFVRAHEAVKNLQSTGFLPDDETQRFYPIIEEATDSISAADAALEDERIANLVIQLLTSEKCPGLLNPSTGPADKPSTKNQGKQYYPLGKSSTVEGQAYLSCTQAQAEKLRATIPLGTKPLRQ